MMTKASFSYIRRPPLDLLAELSCCGGLHLLSGQQDRPPLLLRVPDGLLNVDLPALVDVLVVTETLAPPPQVVHRAVALGFAAQDGLRRKHGRFFDAVDSVNKLTSKVGNRDEWSDEEGRPSITSISTLLRSNCLGGLICNLFMKAPPGCPVSSKCFYWF